MSVNTYETKYLPGHTLCGQLTDIASIGNAILEDHDTCIPSSLGLSFVLIILVWGESWTYSHLALVDLV
jgi:hypothetical protein